MVGNSFTPREVPTYRCLRDVTTSSAVGLEGTIPELIHPNECCVFPKALPLELNTHFNDAAWLKTFGISSSFAFETKT